MKRRKTSEDDGISVAFMKDAGEIADETLKTLFNCSMKEEYRKVGSMQL